MTYFFKLTADQVMFLIGSRAQVVFSAQDRQSGEQVSVDGAIISPRGD